MDIYVQSRGISKGYCWLDKSQTKISELPNNLKQMLEMVDGDYFSLVIYRANGQLSLLVTALKSQNRIDNQTRKICNSLLWVGKDSDEATLRKLSIQALNGELAAKVDEAVASENNDQGFTVNFDLLKPEKLGLPSVENDPADHKEHKVGNLSACKDELIGDLKKYALPKRDGMLVVVCSTVSKSSLEREQVWRGLSDAISDDDWIDISSADSKKSSKEDKGDNFRRQPNSGNADKYSQPSTTSISSKSYPPSSKLDREKTGGASKQKKTLDVQSFILGLVVGLILGVALTLLFYHPEKQLQQTIHNLETRVEQEIKAYETFKSEVENSYNKFIEDSDNFKQVLEKELKTLQDKSDELEPKSS